MQVQFDYCSIVYGQKLNFKYDIFVHSVDINDIFYCEHYHQTYLLQLGQLQTALNICLKQKCLKTKCFDLCKFRAILYYKLYVLWYVGAHNTMLQGRNSFILLLMFSLNTQSMIEWVEWLPSFNDNYIFWSECEEFYGWWKETVIL